MANIIRLAPHDPLPDGRSVIVMRRFEEDDARHAITEIILNGRSGRETARPSSMTLDDAVSQAVKVADSEGIPVVHVVDRLSGEREQDILSHHGDHSVHMESLSDTDLEEGERGPDMRDVVHDTRQPTDPDR